jgi:uncharacterized protein (DUF1499 family)
LRYYLHRSRQALWSQRTALLFFLLFALTFILHRFGVPNLSFGIESTAIPKVGISVPLPHVKLDEANPLVQLSTPVAMKLFGVAIAGALIAVGLGFASLLAIWRDGNLGASKALSGVLLGTLMLAVPLWSLPDLLALPRIHEVTTDPERPPAFQKLALVRNGDGFNPATYQKGEATLQMKAYPDIKPLPVNRPTADAYSAVRDAVKNLDWHVVTEQPPGDGRSGMIEAVDRSFIFGFTDDVVIRVSGAGRDAKVDVRSSARHGRHDLGRNAERVRELFSEVKTRLAEIEKNESMERAVALREKRVQKAMTAKEQRERKRKAALLAKAEAVKAAAAASAAATPSTAPQLAGSTSGGSGPQGTADPGRGGRALSRSEAQAAQAQNSQQRPAEKPKSLRRFWEQLLE